MPHSKNLRAIGQSLEVLRIEVFELEKQGDTYIVRSESLSPTAQPMFRKSLVEKVWDSPDVNPKTADSGHRWLRYDPLDISWLDDQGRKIRRTHSFAETRGTRKLSQLLRTVGEHLDEKEVRTFNISWSPDCVSVDYRPGGGRRERKDFTVESLHELGSSMRFRRSSRDR
jgi:hypothetical protein